MFFLEVAYFQSNPCHYQTKPTTRQRLDVSPPCATRPGVPIKKIQPKCLSLASLGAPVAQLFDLD